MIKFPATRLFWATLIFVLISGIQASSLSAQLSVWQDGQTGASSVFNGETGTTYDPVAEVFVICQREQTPAGSVMVTRTYDPITKAVTPIMTPTQPPGRIGFRFVYDAGRQKHVLLTGFQQGSGNSTSVWEFDIATGWTEVIPASAPLLLRSAAGYVPTLGGIVVAGGLTLGETLLWDGTSWSLLTSQGPTSGATALASAGMAYDPVRDVLVIHGGNIGANFLNDTWEFDVATLAWTQVNPAPPLPPVSQYGSLYFDPTLGVIVAHLTDATTMFGSETWFYDGVNWTENPDVSGGSGGPGDFAFDPVNGVGLMARTSDAPTSNPSLPLSYRIYTPFYGSAHPGMTDDAAILPLPFGGPLASCDGRYDIEVSGSGANLPMFLLARSTGGNAFLNAPTRLLVTVQSSSTPISGLSFLGGGVADVWVDPNNVSLVESGVPGAGPPSLSVATFGLFNVAPSAAGHVAIAQLLLEDSTANPIGLVLSNAAVLSFH